MIAKTRVKKILFAFIALVVIVICVFVKSDVSENSQKIIKLQASDSSLVVCDKQPNVVQVSYKLCAPQVYYGDALYVSETVENISDKTQTVADHTVNGHSIWDLQPIYCFGKISCDGITQSYEWRFETYEAVVLDLASVWVDLSPAEALYYKPFRLEFPPLEDWNAPFWKELRESLPPEGRICTLELPRRFTIQVLVKPRPKEEMTILEEWYRKTPHELFPKSILNNQKAVFEFGEDSPLKNYPLQVGSEQCSPWQVLILGNRKPNAPNLPDTLSGWRELEERFKPSTIRDEITFARLHLEYLSESDANASDLKLKELVDWVRARPEPQRVVFTTFLVTRPDFDRAGAFKAKYDPLLKALEPDLSRELARRRLDDNSAPIVTED